MLQVSGIERQVDKAGSQACKVDKQAFRGFVDLHDYPVTGLEAHRTEPRGVGRAALFQVAIAIEVTAISRADEGGTGCESVGEQVIEIVLWHISNRQSGGRPSYPGPAGVSTPVYPW